MMIILQIGKLSKRHVLKTKMIIINNPHNPTGILSESDFGKPIGKIS
jgi:aspartate/methionine/tyrosine aminotransferase